MPNVKIRNLTEVVDKSEINGDSFVATALSLENQSIKVTRKFTLNQVISGGAPQYSGDFSYGNFVDGLKIDGRDVVSSNEVEGGGVSIPDPSDPDKSSLVINKEGSVEISKNLKIGGSIESSGTIKVNGCIVLDECMTGGTSSIVIKKNKLVVKALEDVLPSDLLPVASDKILGAIKVGGGLNILNGVLSVPALSGGAGNKIPSSSLPVAATDAFGVIKVGSGLSINSGILSVPSLGGGGAKIPTGALPIATKTTVGVVQAGTGLSISSTGVLSGRSDDAIKKLAGDVINSIPSTPPTLTIGTSYNVAANPLDLNEGAQSYWAFPTVTGAEAQADPEGNSYSVDVYRDSNGNYGFGVNAIFLRVFSPFQRTPSSLPPTLFTPRGGFQCAGLVVKGDYPGVTYTRASASKGDQMLSSNVQGNLDYAKFNGLIYRCISSHTSTVGTTPTSAPQFWQQTLELSNAIAWAPNVAYKKAIMQGDSFTVSNVASGGITSQRNINAGWNTHTTAATNVEHRWWNYFVASPGNLHFTVPGKTTGGKTVLSLTAAGALSTLSGGTSDERVKYDITEISEKESRVARKIKSSIKKFKRLEEGEDKWKIGVIAQEVINYFKEEGLDFAKYDMIESKPAFAKLDENGKITSWELASSIDIDENAEIKTTSGSYTGSVSKLVDSEKNETEDDHEHICVTDCHGNQNKVKKTEVLEKTKKPPQGMVDTEIYFVDYDQLLTFVVSSI